jgi:phosphatidylglycerol:prolipoprotein diacylglycerol transferase
MHPILIDIGFFQLSTYGTMVALAYLTAILWLKTQIAWMPGMDEDKFWFMIYGLFCGAILGGKLLFVALEWRTYAAGGLRLFVRDFRYGFVFFGGFLGAALAGVLIARRIKAPYLATADFFGVALPMGHWIGRLGCLGAGCCYGRPTTVPWAVRLGGNPASVTPIELWGAPLHPTQLYEAFAELAICLFLLFAILPLAKKHRLAHGTVFFGWVGLYSIARFFIEFYRGDERGGFLWSLSVSQWIALGCLAAVAALFARRGVLAEGLARGR